jgi:small neutral amino acid transporter SnatA (MarC family)
MSYRIRKQGFRQGNKEEKPSYQTEKSSILPIATPAAAGSGGNEALSVQLPSSSLSFPIAFLSLSLSLSLPIS